MNEKTTKYVKLGDVLNVITNYRYTDLMFCDIKRLTAIDAVPVVRCKDCAFSEDYTQNGRLYCDRFGCTVKENGFCYCGTKKTEESK